MEKKALEQIRDLQRSIVSQTSNSLQRINSLTEGLDRSPNAVRVVDVSPIEEENTPSMTPRTVNANQKRPSNSSSKQAQSVFGQRSNEPKPFEIE